MDQTLLYNIALLVTGITGLLSIVLLVLTLPKGSSQAGRARGPHDPEDGAREADTNENGYSSESEDGDAIDGDNGPDEVRDGGDGTAAHAQLNVSRRAVLRMQRKREKADRRMYMNEMERQRQEKQEKQLREREARDWAYEEQEEEEQRSRARANRVSAAWRAVFESPISPMSTSSMAAPSAPHASDTTPPAAALIAHLHANGPVIRLSSIARALGMGIVECRRAVSEYMRVLVGANTEFYVHYDTALEQVYCVHHDSIAALRNRLDEGEGGSGVSCTTLFDHFRDGESR